uniref:Uncharacterized protein n=1 Tax=Timema monikensis TaxID=170555 RepID=A0A7R9E823_9NEOP|nr:unnamed protein product [Timema monikensis]
MLTVSTKEAVGLLYSVHTTIVVDLTMAALDETQNGMLVTFYKCIKYLVGNYRFVRKDLPIGRRQDDRHGKKGSIRNRVREFFKSGATLVAMSAVYFCIAILFGAEIFSKHEETYMLSLLLCVLTIFPACLNVGAHSVLSLLLGIRPTPDLLGVMLVRNMQFTLFGTWLGAFVIPLDWDRPWQAWPVPCSADDVEDSQPLQKLVALLRRGHLGIDAKAVLSFDKHLRTEGVEKAADLVQSDPADQEYYSVNIDEESYSGQTIEDLKIKTYYEALCAVSEYFEEFAAFKNFLKLMALMQEAMEKIQKAFIQKTTKQPTLMDIIMYTSKRCSLPCAACDKLEGTCADLLACPCHTHNHRHTPALVAGFESCTHGRRLRWFHDHCTDYPRLRTYLKLVWVKVNSNNPLGPCSLAAHSYSQTNSSQTPDGTIRTRFNTSCIQGGTIPSRNPTAQQAYFVQRGILVHLNKRFEFGIQSSSMDFLDLHIIWYRYSPGSTEVTPSPMLSTTPPPS